MANQNKKPQYFGTIPEIAQAYKNDPRTQLAAAATALGTSTAPVAQGAWAVPDGLARAAQAVLGAYVSKKQGEKYAAREADYIKAQQAASALANTPNPAASNPATANPGLAAAANALGGQQPPQMAPRSADQVNPIQTVDPDAAMWPQGPASGPQGAPGATPPPSGTGLPLTPPVTAPQGLPPGASMPPPGAAPGGLPQAASIVPPSLPMNGGTGPNRGAVNYFRQGIVPIEGGTDKNGRFLTSPAGAYGPSQLMPGTAPEAMALAGYDKNDRRWRTDADVNLAAGEAYYNKQLQDFGDPLKAAAAYNGGPTALRRVLRRARAAGDEANWLSYYPKANTETPKYVRDFAAKIGAAGNPQVSQPAMQIAAPSMEAVPNGPAAPSAQAPAAPQRPAEVQSNRLAMAQQLMASGNPDVMAIAQSYLDKGLDEQNNARTLASQQEFAQGQTGYGAQLNNWQDANSQYRQDAYGQRRDAQTRNFQREQTYRDQTFRAGESALDRAQQTSERQASQQYDFAKTDYGLKFGADEADKTRQNKLDVAGQRQQQAANRNAYFSTATGLKMQAEAGNTINRNAQTIASLERFMDLNDNQRSGGVLGAVGITGAYSAVNDAIAEMRSISSNTTLSALGGSLGTAISDGDRKFIAGANVSSDLGRGANTNIARAVIGSKRRENDYLTEFSNAQADGTAPQFARDWALFAKSVPIVQYDKNGNAVATDKPMTFSQWQSSRPKFDATGKRVN